VSYTQFPAFRSPLNFTRPDDFLPERFLPDKPDEFAQDNLDAFHPFNIGRHTCLGQRLGLAEVRLVLARLLYAFDMTLADEKDTMDFGEQKTHIFWDKEPLMVCMSVRGRG